MTRLRIVFGSSGDVTISLVAVGHTSSTLGSEKVDETILPIDIKTSPALTSVLNISLEPIARHLARYANFEYDVPGVEDKTHAMLMNAQIMHREKMDRGEKDAERTWAAVTLALTRFQGLSQDTDAARLILQRLADAGDQSAEDLLRKFSIAHPG